MPRGSSGEAGRAGLWLQVLTQRWERPSCNKAAKSHAQQQSTKAPQSRRRSQPLLPAPPRQHVS